jgi:hypothetical protein
MPVCAMQHAVCRALLQPADTLVCAMHVRCSVLLQPTCLALPVISLLFGMLMTGVHSYQV